MFHSQGICSLTLFGIPTTFFCILSTCRACRMLSVCVVFILYIYIYIYYLYLYIIYIHLFVHYIYIYIYIYTPPVDIYSCKTPDTFIYTRICVNHPLQSPPAPRPPYSTYSKQPTRRKKKGKQKEEKKRTRRSKEKNKLSQDTRKPKPSIILDDRESLAIVTGEPSMSSHSLSLIRLISTNNFSTP